MSLTLENLNENENLWQSIREAIMKVGQRIQSTLTNDDFQYKFLITDYCWEEGESFINVGELFYTIPVTYIKDRFTTKAKQWHKEVDRIENSLGAFLPNFKLPEQYYLGKPNPLLKIEQLPVLQCENIESKLYSFNELQELLGFSFKTKYADNLKFKLFFNKLDFTTSEPCEVGLNFFKDDDIVNYSIKLQVLISSSLEYCRYVENSTVNSPVIYLEYIKKQLAAFFADTDYPSLKINVTAFESQPFDLQNIGNFQGKFYRNLVGDILYLQTPDLSFDSYIRETITGYDPSKRKVVKHLGEIASVQNKIINIDPNSLRIVYTNETGSMESFDFSEFAQVSITPEFCNSYLSRKCSDQEFSNFLKIFKIFCNPSGMDLTKMSLLDLFESFDSSKISNLYNSWDSLDLPIRLKLFNKLPLYLFMFKNTFKEPEIEGILQPQMTRRYANIGTVDFPLRLSQILQTPIHRFAVVDSSEFYKLDVLIDHLNVLKANSKTKKSCIITTRSKDAFTKLYQFADSPVIVDKETLPELQRLFGSNLITYFNELSTNSPVIVNPNCFGSSEILGEDVGFIGNEKVPRNLVLELLRNIQFDYVGIDLDSFGDDVFDQIIQICNKSKYLVISTATKTNRLVDIMKMFGIEYVYSMTFDEIQPINDAPIHLKSYSIQIPEIQRDFYAQTFVESKNMMEGSEDYLNVLNNSNLINFGELEPIANKYLGFPQQFLNTPASKIFTYGEAFDGDIEQKKIDTLLHYLYCCKFGGVFEDNLFPGGDNSTKILLFSNKESLSKFSDAFKEYFKVVLDQYNLGSQVQLYLDIEDVFELKSLASISEIITFDMKISKDNLKRIYNTLEKYSIYKLNLEQNFSITTFYFGNTIESSNYYLNLKALQKLLTSQINGTQVDIDNILDLLDFEGKSTEEVQEVENATADLLKIIFDKSMSKFNSLQSSILKKYGYKVSKETLKKFYRKEYLVVEDVSQPILFPFKNFMKLDVGLGNFEAKYKNLGFVDENEKPCYFINKNFLNDEFLTELGFGKEISAQNSTAIIDVNDYKKVVFDKELLFAEISFAPSLDTMKAFIKDYGLTIQPNYLKITDPESKQDAEQVEDENEAVLNCGFVNGYPMLYSTNSSTNLAKYGFKYFKNVFVLEEDNEEVLKSDLNNMPLSEDQKVQIINVFDELKSGNKVKLPAQMNYFIAGNIPDKNFRAFPVIIGEKFYLFINGYFYQKECYKLSRKLVALNMIETLFYLMESSINLLKSQFYKISKTLNIQNLQECVDFFNTKAPVFKELPKAIPEKKEPEKKLVNPLYNEKKIEQPKSQKLEEKSNKLKAEVARKRKMLGV